MLDKARFASKQQFEQRFHKRLSQKSYQPRDLVLVHNTAIEMSHDRKHKPQYLGPYEVFEKTIKGNYKLKELDGTELQYKYVAFRILPYITRNHAFMHTHEEDAESQTESDTGSSTDSGISDSD